MAAGVDTRVIGSTGYVDPEYQMTGRLTTASDVFSLGVVILEVGVVNHAWLTHD